MQAGRVRFWIDVPSGWVEAPKPRTLIPCATSDPTCVFNGIFLVLVPASADLSNPNLKVSFTMRADGARREMTELLDQERGCVWPRQATSLRCLSELLPFGAAYQSILYPQIEAKDVRISLLVFRSRTDEHLPLYASAYVPIGDDILQIVFRGATEPDYDRGIAGFRQLLGSLRPSPLER
jgi:hypothetical protein